MSQNDITGDEITSKAASDEYRANYDRIFRKQAPEQAPVQPRQQARQQASEQALVQPRQQASEQALVQPRQQAPEQAPVQARPTYREIVKTYKKIGCANSTNFQEPAGSGPWRRCHQSVSGCYEVYCDDKLQIYYDCFCD